MLQVDGPAPYAPATAITAVIDRHRERSLQTVDLQTLQRMSVTDSLAPRTLQALKLLGLVDDESHPTPAFERVRVASSDTFKAEVAAIVREAYKPVFDIVDPVTASGAQIEDAFRGFTPPGQRTRMVALFVGLLAYADLIEPQRSRPGPRPTSGTPKKRTGRNGRADEGRTDGPEFEHEAEPEHEALGCLQPQPRGDEHTVELASGGRVTVVLDVNLFALTAADRDFVLGVVDALRGYRAEQEGADSKDL